VKAQIREAEYSRLIGAVRRAAEDEDGVARSARKVFEIVREQGFHVGRETVTRILRSMGRVASSSSKQGQN
jgi:hypothetical protein